MGIVKTGKIQSMGEPIGELYVKSLWFEQINSGTSGTLTPPAQGEIVLDQWSAGVDALASTIASGIPAFVSPVTSGGVIVTATLDSSGNWTLSGTPSAYPVAIVYAYQVKFRFFDYTKQLGGYELIPAAGGVFTDVTNFGGKLSSADTTVQKGLDTLDDHGHSGVYEPAATAIQTHINGTGTPQTAAGVGADPAGTGHTEAAAHVTVHENAYTHGDIALNTAARHAALTIGADGEHSLLGQVLSGVDAAATQKGHIQLAGELEGSATAPTVKSTHSGSAHHTAVSLAVSADVLLGLSTQELSLDTQAANLGFFGPVSGAAAAPTFRAMVNADLPVVFKQRVWFGA